MYSKKMEKAEEKKIKICFITTVSATLKAFVNPFAEYIHDNTDWNIYYICDQDEQFNKNLPSYINYIPVSMKRGIDIGFIGNIKRIYEILSEINPDIVQYSTPNASFYTSIASRLAKVPNRLYCQWGIVYVGFSGVKRMFFKQLERITCRLSTVIEPDSNSNLLFSVSEGLYAEEKARVIWNGSACGVDFSKFDIRYRRKWRKEGRAKYGILQDAFVFGFVGRVTRDKGINELLSAYKEMLSDCYLLLVGPEEEDSTIDENLYKWSKQNDRIIYVGYTDEVEKYMAVMDCYVLPSYREGFGLGVVEAGAMGLPAIVTDIPGPRDSVENGVNGFLVLPKNKDDLREKMEVLVNDKSGYSTLSQNAFDKAKKKYERKHLMKCMLEDRMELL